MAKQNYMPIGLITAALSLFLIVYPNIGWSQNQVMLPLLHGQTWEQANQQLSALGLKSRRVPPQDPCTDEFQLNRVLRQHPEPGVWLAPGSQVVLVTCSPVITSPQRQVPDLSGLTLSQAKIQLQRLDLKLRYSYNNKCLDPFLQEKIIKQEPAPLSQTKRGSVVWVSICRGTP